MARLEPAARGRVSAEALVGRFRSLPGVDAQRLRQDIDEVLEQRL